MNLIQTIKSKSHFAGFLMGVGKIVMAVISHSWLLFIHAVYNQNACRQGRVEPTDSAPDAFKREVQGRCSFAEGVHGGLPAEKDEEERGRGPAILCGGNHEAIISPAVFDMAQAELAKRTKDGTRYSGVSIFSNKIKYADCGGWYGSKVWHSTDRYRKVIYRCNKKYNGGKCQTPHVTEDEVKAAFVSAYNQLVTEKKEIIANAEIIRKTLCVTDALQEEKGKLEEEMAVLVEMTQNIVAGNARVAQNQDEYQKRYDSPVGRYDTAKARYDEVVTAISAKEAQSERLANFIKVLKMQDGTISEFNGSLWGSMVEFATVGRKKEIIVTFRDGTEIQA